MPTVLESSNSQHDSLESHLWFPLGLAGLAQRDQQLQATHQITINKKLSARLVRVEATTFRLRRVPGMAPIYAQRMTLTFRLRLDDVPVAGKSLLPPGRARRRAGRAASLRVADQL